MYPRTTILAGFALLVVTGALVRGAKESRHIPGTFTLTPNGVIDGDTIRVQGLKQSLRLQGIDTEEVYMHREEWGRVRERERAEANWQKYVAENLAAGNHKFGTPLGMEASSYARKLLEGITTVRLVYDDPLRKRGYYGRHLVQVFYTRNGKEYNFGVEMVRAGYTPYFPKYGFSRIGHDDYVTAQIEAMKARRGIWDPTRKHYPDYDQRLPWWWRRAHQLRRGWEDGRKEKHFVSLMHNFGDLRLLDYHGREVLILGTAQPNTALTENEGALVFRLAYNNWVHVDVTYRGLRKRSYRKRAASLIEEQGLFWIRATVLSEKAEAGAIQVAVKSPKALIPIDVPEPMEFPFAALLKVDTDH